jgi:hypothetical protein
MWLDALNPKDGDKLLSVAKIYIAVRGLLVMATSGSGGADALVRV